MYITSINITIIDLNRNKTIRKPTLVCNKKTKEKLKKENKLLIRSINISENWKKNTQISDGN